MNREKIIQSMMILLSLQFYAVQSHEIVSSQHTTLLIELVKKQEDHLLELQKEKPALMDRCVGEYYRGSYRHYGYDGFYIKKWSSSMVDLKKLYNIQQQIFDADGTVLKERMTDLIKQGESFDAVDTHNHTALYYAKSADVYDALRSSGASFELLPFLYIYQWYTIPALTALFYIMYTLYEVGYFSIDRCIRCSQNVYDETLSRIDDIKKIINKDEVVDPETDVKKPVYDRRDMQCRDEQGRTRLMNYIIKQEAALITLRVKIDTLWNDHVEWLDDTEWDEYYAIIVQHQAMCHQTQVHIKKMIELGADVNIQDMSGKTLLDYCATKEIYKTLLALGADFQIDSWAYFNYDYYVKQAPIIAPILATTFVITMYMTMRKNMSFKDERDEWFMNWARANL